MDTWATSSLTPQIVGRWTLDDDLFERVFPMDLRPQAHEIIRTWLFSTAVRAELEHGVLPWRETSIAGWVLDPDRKKMSKSKGNVIDAGGPAGAVRLGRGALLGGERAPRRRHGGGRRPDEGRPPPGDEAAQREPVRAGSRACRLASAVAVEPLDRALLASLSAVVSQATAALEALDYARALQVTETFFWTFCDDYVELVKGRAYGDSGPEGAQSAQAALVTALSAVLRLFAPFLPFATEEVWSWWQPGSVHRAVLAFGVCVRR